MYGMRVMGALLCYHACATGWLHTLARARATVELHVDRRDAMSTVEREVTVAAPPEEVWSAVTHADEVSAWFGAHVEIEVRPGGRGVFRWPDGTERHALVEEVEPARRLSFRWLPFQRTAAGEIVAVPSTRVEITLDGI